MKKMENFTERFDECMKNYYSDAYDEVTTAMRYGVEIDDDLYFYKNIKKMVDPDYVGTTPKEAAQALILFKIESLKKDFDVLERL